MAERAFDVVVIGAGSARRGDRRPARAKPGSRSRSSRSGSWAGSARSSPACRRRRSCGRESSPPRRGACRASRRARSTPTPCSRDATRSSTTSTTPPSCRGSRSAASPSCAVTAVSTASGWCAWATTSCTRGVPWCSRAGARRRSRRCRASRRRIRGRTSRRRRRSTCPARLFVLGGGVVGVEMAQAWSSLGSDVTLVHRGDRLIEREERFAGAQVEAALREAGVDVRLQTSRDGGGAERGGADRARRRHHARRRTRSSSRSGGRRGRRTSGVETVGLEPGKHVRGRRVAPRPGARLALRGRRRQRPRAPHAHGEVPGAPRRRRDPREDGAAALGRRRLAARDLHRPAGGRRRADPRGRDRRPGCACGPSTSRRAATPAAPSSGAARPGHPGSSSTRSGASWSARRSPARRSPSRCTRRRSPSSPRCRSSDLWHAVPSFPTRSELWLRLLEAYGLCG